MELDAEVEADDVPLRAKNCLTPTRFISLGVQKELTFDWMCAYFLLVGIFTAGLLIASFRSRFDGVRKLRESRDAF